MAVGNRVLLRRGDHSFFGHLDLCHLVASSFVCRVLACTGEHRTDDDFLLAFATFLHGVHEFFGRPLGNVDVRVGNFFANVEGSKGWYVAFGSFFVVLPVGQSDFALKKDDLRCADIDAEVWLWLPLNGLGI